MRKSFQTQAALFAPAEVLEHPAMKALDGLEALVDWGAVEALLPRGEGKAATGRPGYPALMLFRALLLGQLYRLSDVQLASQLMRDLLFRRFCRIELDQRVPDAVTLGRFRAALEGRMDELLALVNRSLAAKNLILTEGQIASVDASVVEAAQSGLKTRDPEAGSAVKHDSKGRMTAVWGWRGFVTVDEDTFVHRTGLPPAMPPRSGSWRASCSAPKRGSTPMPPISGPRRGRCSPPGAAARASRTMSNAATRTAAS